MAQKFQQFSNLLVLAALIALGIWGHVNHWQLSAAHGHAESAPAGHAAPDHRDHDAAATGAIDPTIHGALEKDGGEQIVRFESTTAVSQVGIRVASANATELEEYVSANGVVSYDESRLAQLSSHVAGIAWRVEKHVGDAVQKGDVLAILDSIEVGNAKARFLEAAVDYDVKAQNLQNLEQISSSVPAKTLREARGSVREARIQRYNARQALINLGLPPPQELAQVSDEDLMQQIQFLGIPSSIVAALDPLTATANLLPITAPFDGVIISSELVQGEVVQPAHHQFVIADVSRMWIRLNVKKTDAVRLALGQEVQFLADGAAAEINSQVSWIGTEVDEKTRRILVRTVIDNPRLPGTNAGGPPPRLLRAKTYGTARIRVRDRRPAVVVPAEAIQWHEQRHIVFVAQPDGRSFAMRLVTPGMTEDGLTEIVAGVAEGEQVVVAGSHVLKSELSRQASGDAPP